MHCVAPPQPGYNTRLRLRTRSHGRRACVRACLCAAGAGSARLHAATSGRLRSASLASAPVTAGRTHPQRHMPHATLQHVPVQRARRTAHVHAHTRARTQETAGPSRIPRTEEGDRRTARGTAREGGRADALRSRHCTRRRKCCALQHKLRHVATRDSRMQHYSQHSTLQHGAARCNAAARLRPCSVTCATDPCIAHVHARTARRMCVYACAHCPVRACVGGLFERCCAPVRLDGAASGVLCHATPARCVATQCSAVQRGTAAACALQWLQRAYRAARLRRGRGRRASIHRLQECVRGYYFRQRQGPAGQGRAYRTG